MIRKNRFWLIPLILMALGLIFINSCTKDDDEVETGDLTDKDGNVYTSVTIGTQEWMVENLKTTKYNDGTPIPLVTDNAEWEALNTPGYCWYDNDAATYKNPYGALYNWYAVNTGKLCPTGWHVPTDAEWKTFTDYLGGEDVAGGKLKEIGTTHWDSPNTGATNETGFTGLPGGMRYDNGPFVDFGSTGRWWSATECGASCAFVWCLDYSEGGLLRYFSFNEWGFSVRCIKN
jgi:uncharacterized protein (TIGR02145 family)